jgi:hypothetical protein
MSEESARPEATAPEREDLADLRRALDALNARIAALEQAAGARAGAAAGLAAAGRTLQRRAAAAWTAWRGSGSEPSATGPAGAGTAGAAAREGWFGTLILVTLGLLAALLAIELAEEIGKAVRRLWRWIT